MPRSGDRDRPTGDVQAGDVVEQAAKPVRLLARVGLVAYGLIHLVVAALIVQVVFGDHERADKKGALQEIAESGSGRVLLWVVVAGLAALVVLRLVDAVSAYRRLDGWRRVGRMAVAAGEAVVYTVLARSAATIAQAEGGDSFSKSVVAALFGLPGGPFLVGLVGVALVAAGGYAVVHGLRRDFLRDLALPPRFRTPVGVLGTVGWTALGAAGATAGVPAGRGRRPVRPRRTGRPRRRDPDPRRPTVRPGPAARAGRRPGGLRRLLPVRRPVPDGVTVRSLPRTSRQESRTPRRPQHARGARRRRGVEKAARYRAERRPRRLVDLAP